MGTTTNYRDDRQPYTVLDEKCFGALKGCIVYLFPNQAACALQEGRLAEGIVKKNEPQPKSAEPESGSAGESGSGEGTPAPNPQPARRGRPKKTSGGG